MCNKKKVTQIYTKTKKKKCRVTLCSPNPKELGCKPNEPNTINL